MRLRFRPSTSNCHRFDGFASHPSGIVNTRATSCAPTRKTVGHLMIPTTGVTLKCEIVIMFVNLPNTLTLFGSTPISSSVSRKAVCSGVVSPSSQAPPGKETCPLCDSTLSVRRVNSKCHSSTCHTNGTSTAAHFRCVSAVSSISA